MSLVLESSVALAWAFKDETTSAIRSVVDQLNRTGAWVPSFWRIEVANGFEMGVRRGRATAAFRDATLSDLAMWQIQIDSETDRHAWNNTLRLAERHRLTLYDATYLELALRRAIPLATLDRALRSAASSERIVLLGV